MKIIKYVSAGLVVAGSIGLYLAGTTQSEVTAIVAGIFVLLPALMAIIKSQTEVKK